MRAFAILLAAIVLAPTPRLAYADSVADPGAGFLSYKHKKATKDYFVVRGQGDQCSIVQGDFTDKPEGAVGSAPYASKQFAEAALKKLPECKGGESTDFDGKKHKKK